MQPPPRKVKESQQMKVVFSEQLSKLQTKQHQDTELLEEIRYYTLFVSPDCMKSSCGILWTEGDEQGDQYRNAESVFSVWRSVVDATAQTAASRLFAAEEYRRLIGQVSRSLRNGLEQLQRVQAEVVDALRELHRVKKCYYDFSHIANVAREKTADAQTRARKSEHGIFHFKTGLQKITTKLTARLKECEDRLAEVRNEYLLTLAAVSAHRQHYYTNDLPFIMLSSLIPPTAGAYPREAGEPPPQSANPDLT
uniref:F-BAR domain-containing protein n=1 Tax=Amphilophus citrinellus TaxID=61819 RepID=A0A3Q0SSJ8_AMPCI